MAIINTYDRSLKVIARNHAALFLRLALPNLPIHLTGTLQNVELSLPVQPVDFVHQALYEGNEHLLHMEFQLQHFKDFPRRLRATHGALTQQYKLPVLSFALYLKYRKSSIPNEYVVRVGKQVIHRFTYPVIKLWDYADRIRSGEFRELAPLLVVLANKPDEQLLQAERQLILKEPNDEKRADLLSLALTLASRHFDRTLLRRLFREEINQMRGQTLIEELLDEWSEERVHEAVQDTSIKQLRKDISFVLRVRFALAETQLTVIQSSLEPIQTIEQLEVLLQHAINDINIGEFQTRLQQLNPVQG